MTLLFIYSFFRKIIKRHKKCGRKRWISIWFKFANGYSAITLGQAIESLCPSCCETSGMGKPYVPQRGNDVSNVSISLFTYFKILSLSDVSRHQRNICIYDCVICNFCEKAEAYSFAPALSIYENNNERVFLDYLRAGSLFIFALASWKRR